LLGVDFLVGPVKEFALVGEMGDPRTRELLSAIFKEFLPNKVLAFSAGKVSAKMNLFPLLEGKTLVGGKPAVYVCENYTCRAPVDSKEELKSLLSRSTPT